MTHLTQNGILYHQIQDAGIGFTLTPYPDNMNKALPAKVADCPIASQGQKLLYAFSLLTYNIKYSSQWTAKISIYRLYANFDEAKLTKRTTFQF